MSEFVICEKSDLDAIADAIRGKTGGTEEMTLDQMAAEIEGIEVGGGGGDDFLQNLISGTPFSAEIDSKTIASYAFYYNQYITSVSLFSISSLDIEYLSCISTSFG